MRVRIGGVWREDERSERREKERESEWELREEVRVKGEGLEIGRRSNREVSGVRG